MTSAEAPRGRFLVLEGVDGAGKSTQLPRIAARLRGVGVETRTTREPGGTLLGESLRAVLLDPQFTGMSPAAELLVMFAARAEHLAKFIAPALEDGVWVLCERFTDATFAYQGGGRAVDSARIAALEEVVQDGIRPDLVLLLDVPVEVGCARAKGRRPVPRGPATGSAEAGIGGDTADRFERESAEFFQRVREVYLDRARKQPERYAIIDASADVTTVTEHVIREILQRFP